jgi:hypothetical protein
MRGLGWEQLRRLASCVAWLVFGWAWLTQAQAAGGLYVLHSARQALDPTVLDPAFVQGIALQVGWREVEPAEGSYEWGAIEEVLRAARLRRKSVTVHLMPMFPPPWVYRAGVEPFSYQIENPRNPNVGRTFTQYVPWDPTFLRLWGRLVREFGKQFAGDPTLFAVSVAAPVPEMALFGGFPGSSAAQKWASIYDQAAYRKAWRTMVDAYGEAFPRQVKFIAPGLVQDDAGFADDVLGYATSRLGDRLCVFNAGLNATMRAGPQGMGSIYAILERYGKIGCLGFQMVWNATDDPRNRLRGSLSEAVMNGRRMGASYVEIYEVDVKNPVLAGDLARTAQLFR